MDLFSSSLELDNLFSRENVADYEVAILLVRGTLLRCNIVHRL